MASVFKDDFSLTVSEMFITYLGPPQLQVTSPRLFEVKHILYKVRVEDRKMGYRR